MTVSSYFKYWAARQKDRTKSSPRPGDRRDAGECSVPPKGMAGTGAERRSRRSRLDRRGEAFREGLSGEIANVCALYNFILG